ncbi:VWA domain-containing protein [Candidatus Parabeggiatoa sp. HSG14]|uniref:vWA domain-containing protein n=1 Tax=Candidatus Parabeggiatoa sp. HSG14 TaxID=3055593 RepID=UPI0032E383C1
MPEIVQADQIKVNAALATPVLLADKKQTVYLRVGLTGFLLEKEKVAPVNVGLVIDKSGSMQGEKIRRAKDAAIMAVERLRNSDILSVVTYDHHAKVLLPATKAQDNETIINAINKLTAGGQTALFDGMEKGAKEVRKFLDRKRVNRIVLVSDGLANVGPSSPEELGVLGTSLGKENMTVTTIGLGLGYNEDLMAQLAKKSDGNHAFAENGKDLIRFFNHEFGDILSVVAQEVNVTIIAVNGVRPVRVLGRGADIEDGQVLVKLNQLYSEQEKYVLVELEVPPSKINKERVIAGVAVVYRNMGTDTSERLSSTISATFTDSPQIVKEKTNATVMTAAIEQLAVEKNKLAVKLRDEGKVKEAKEVLLDNATFLAEEAAKYDSEKLEELQELNLEDAENLDEDNWAKQRKSMRREQHKSETQQMY